MRRFGGGAVAVRGSSDSGMVRRRRRAASVLFSALAVCAIHAQNDARWLPCRDTMPPGAIIAAAAAASKVCFEN